MANIQSYLEQIEGARYGKDVRSSIVNAIDAVNKESEESVEKVSSISTIASNTLLKADAATVNANNAATQANEAANNANEAAQAIFDEKYILTATTEMVKSGTAKPTARGNALMENLIADSYQKQLSGKNKLNPSALTKKTLNGVTFTPVLNTDGTLAYVNINGTPTDGTSEVLYEFWSDKASLPTLIDKNIEYKISINEIGIEGLHIQVYQYINGWNHVATVASNTKFMISEDATGIIIRLRVGGGYTLTNAKAYPMITLATETDQTYEPYCGGTPSPNPDYPQEIESVGDMGWFDGEWLQGYFLDGVVYSYEKCIYSKNYIPCETGDLVKIIYDGELYNATTSCCITYYDVNKTFISQHYAPTTWTGSFEVEAPTNAKYLKFDLRNNVAFSKAENVSVTINGQYATRIKTVGKNLWSHGDISGTGSVTKLPLLLDVGTYTISAIVTSSDTDTPDKNNQIGLRYEDDTMSYFWFSRDVRFSETITIDKKVVSVDLYAGGNANTSAGDTFTWSDIQIEKSETTTPYTSYTHNRTYIPLDEPLRAIGDVKDEVVVRDGKYGVLRRIGEVIYDSANFAESGHAYSNAVYYSLPEPADSISYNTYNLKTVLSDKFRTALTSAFDTTQNIGCITTCAVPTVMWFGFASDTTLEEAQSIGDISVVYQLKEPYYEELDQTPFYNLKSFDEVTNVSIEGLHENVEPTLTMRFPRHEDGALVTTAYCNGKKNEIRMDELTAAMLSLNQN